jgi:hypothetical protein
MYLRRRATAIPMRKVRNTSDKTGTKKSMTRTSKAKNAGRANIDMGARYGL